LARLRDVIKNDPILSGFLSAAITGTSHAARAPQAAPQAAPQRTKTGGPGAERSADGVLVYGKKEVMSVFANVDGNCTVKGYGARSAKCFGEFFLSLDDGPEYRKQSSAINAAISALTGPDGFRMGLEHTRAALAVPSDPPKKTEDVSTDMLAGVAAELFGIPDGELITAGKTGLHTLDHGVCPGDCAPLSGYIFRPEPDEMITRYGPIPGHLLLKQTKTLIARAQPRPGPRGF
jgi:hypothetical protein